VSVNVTGNVVGGDVTLLTLAGDDSRFTLCPTTLPNCIFLDPITSPFANEGATLVEVVANTPGTVPAVPTGTLVVLTALILLAAALALGKFRSQEGACN
jgi:hypothetical protein